MKSERFAAPRMSNRRKTNSHIKGQSEAQSLRFNQIKRVATTKSSRVSLKRMSAVGWYAVAKPLRLTAKVVAIIVGAIIGTLVWAIVRPVIRGAGWVISLITAILIIYWILTF